MKKRKCEMKVCQRCAKGKLRRTFALTLFFLFTFILPDKFSMKGGDEIAERANPPPKFVLKHTAAKLLTLQNFKFGGIK
jgi:hypothetical protein